VDPVAVYAAIAGTLSLIWQVYASAGVQITSQEWEAREGTEDENPVPQKVRFLDSHGGSHEVDTLQSDGHTWIATIPPI
jgi:hypothetical protein